MKQSSKIALGGIIAALSVALMFLTGLIPFLTYALPAIAGVLLTLTVIEINKKWSLFIFAAISILSLLIVPDKEAAMMYVGFFGYYPIIKSVLECKLPKILEWVLKFVIFNAAVVISYCIIIYVFGIPLDELREYGKYSLWILLGSANVVFLLYDYCLTKTIDLYLVKWQSRFRKLFG